MIYYSKLYNFLHCNRKMIVDIPGNRKCQHTFFFMSAIKKEKLFYARYLNLPDVSIHRDRKRQTSMIYSTQTRKIHNTYREITHKKLWK